MLCSFSKAAAWELAARNEEIPEHMIGTLHSFAYRAIGQPPWSRIGSTFASGMRRIRRSR